MIFAKMAWRNVWRNRRRSLVTIAATTLALFVMIQYSGLVEGYLIGMERNVLDLELGDVQVFAPGYRDSPSIYTRVSSPEAVLAALDANGFRSSARLLAAGLAAAGDTSAGVSLRGLDVARDAQVSLVSQRVAQGSWLDPADPSGVVVGRRLALTLDVHPGSDLVVLTQAADGSMANETYRVRGVLTGISDGVDQSGVFMLADAFRRLLVLPDGAQQIIVRRPVTMSLPVAAAKVHQLVPDLDAKTWRELSPTLASMLDSTRGAIMVMFVIVYVVIGILMLNATLMAVFERVRELGILKALGTGPTGVLRTILLECAIQTGVAVALAAALSVPALRYLSHHGLDMSSFGGMSVQGVAWDPIWRASVSARTYSGPIVTLVIIVLCAAFYPAVKAAMIRPVDAIRHH